MSRKQILSIFSAIISIAISVVGIFSAYDEVRKVVILTVFAGGFGCGVSLMNISKSRKQKNAS